jgi:hypothetical protein
MTMRRNPRRSRRRTADEMWEPLDWPFHVERETSGNKPGASQDPKSPEARVDDEPAE